MVKDGRQLPRLVVVDGLLRVARMVKDGRQLPRLVVVDGLLRVTRMVKERQAASPAGGGGWASKSGEDGEGWQAASLAGGGGSPLRVARMGRTAGSFTGWWWWRNDQRGSHLA